MSYIAKVAKRLGGITDTWISIKYYSNVIILASVKSDLLMTLPALYEHSVNIS